MKIAGFIAEFNPFHNGHEYLINEIKKDGADKIIVAMSPNFVMRGEPAIFNKKERTEVALLNGVDLVAEIPTIYTLESADIYAKRGVEILYSLGVTDLYFGSETASIEDLMKVGESMLTNEYKNLLAKYLRDGNSFNQSFKKALIELNSEYEVILSSPNNLLGIEYLLAIKELKININVHAIKRIENNYYDSFDPTKNIQSATALRKLIAEGKIWQNSRVSYEFTKHHLKNDYFELIKYRINSSSSSELQEIQGMNEGLENQIKSVSKIANYSELVEALVSKRNRETKINRVLMCILLNIKKNEVNKDPLKYIRILGFNKNGQKYLKEIKNKEVQIIVTIKKGLPIELYREIDFTKIYMGDDFNIKEEYSPVIVG